MTGFTPFEATILDMQSAMARGQTSAVELVEFYLARIEAYDQDGPTLNAVRAVNQNARSIAVERDAERSGGELQSPLHGIPVIVKDNYETLDMATTAGSVLLAEMFTGRDATLVARLKHAGAIVLAKANMHEFAYGITTCGSLFGQTRNPYDPDRHAGGSSGGTAAAVAANFAAVGMGSDTCGSIRIPAAYNNLVGLRGTQGLSSRYGIVPLSHTQDIGGPLARCVEDLTIVLDATVGFDPEDHQTAESVGQIPRSYLEALSSVRLEEARLGVLTNVMSKTGADDVVADVVGDAIGQLATHGAQIVDVDMPHLADLLDDPQRGYLVLQQDFKWDIGDYLSGIAQAPVKTLTQIIDSGACHPALEGRLLTSQSTQEREGPAYLKELARRQELRQALLAEMAANRLDVLMYPTIRREPVVLGEFEQGGSNSAISAKSGLPAISLPAGFSPAGLPVGIELLGPAWSESRLLRLAHAIEQQLAQRRPPELAPPLGNS